MKFTKMHGCGNDYVYVNLFEEKLDDPARVSIYVSDRHFGIGSDGLITIGPSDKADFRMRIYNADGSEAEMCGNGIRCVAKYVYDHKLTDKTEISVQTGAGVKILKLFVEGDKVAGLLMQKEIENLGAVLEKPEKPFVAILGGAKVSDKIGVIENLMKKVNSIVIGGAMANTFLKAKGYDLGDSKYEPEKVEEAKQIMKTAFDTGIEIVLPIDGRIVKVSSDEKLTPETVEKAEDKTCIIEAGIPAGWQMLDVGEQTLDSFYDVITKAKTVVWNGPLGYT